MTKNKIVILFFIIFAQMLADFRLMVFRAVAQCGSFSKAAKELGVSQPAVSNHIAELERTIDDVLFIRKKGEISLTEKGKILLEYANRILHLYDCACAELIPTPSSATSKLKVSVTNRVKCFLPDIFTKFSSIYPNIELIVTERESDEIASMVENRTIHLGIADFVDANEALLKEREQSNTEHYAHFELFASLKVEGSSSLLKDIYFIYLPYLGNKAVEHFILTCKTCL